MKLDFSSLTHHTASRALMQGMIALDNQDLVFDLSAVQRCDSSAVACVLAWARHAQRAGLDWRCVGVPQHLRSLLALYRLEPILPE
jgi:phospholipid transport system transporter-binding protein